MESVFAYFDGEKLIAEKKLSLKKGQKVILTVLDEENTLGNESAIINDTAIKSERFEYLDVEGEHEYTPADLKEKFK